MRTVRSLLVVVVLGLAACGDSEEEAAAPVREVDASEGSVPQRVTTPAASAAKRKKGTKIVVRGSEFGRMLFDSRRQAIYVFERDGEDQSRCYGACAQAWPPVYAKGAPVAGKGVRERLLGTTRRRDGRRQVTYAGRPLYYYAHEAPGEVRCHNVDLNGGLWWVVGPRGRPRP